MQDTHNTANSPTSSATGVVSSSEGQREKLLIGKLRIQVELLQDMVKSQHSLLSKHRERPLKLPDIVYEKL